MKSRSLVVLLIALAAASGSFGQSRPGEKKPQVDPCVLGHKEAVQALMADLADLAAWCEKQKLDRERAHVLELVLAFDPENAAAREALGFVKGKAGAWERSGKWKEPSNRDNEAFGDFKKKRADVGGAFLDKMTQLIEENRRDIEPDVKARIVSDMSAIDSNDPRARAAGGEAQMGGRWVLTETAGAAARRKQLQTWARTAIKNAGTPQPDEPMGSEASWDIKWTAIVTTENLRVMGTGSKEEIEKVAVLCQAAGELFAKVFGVDVTHQTAYRTPIYLISDPTAKSNFLVRNSAIKPKDRERIAQLGGTWADGAIAQWAADSAARIDGSVRMLIGSFMGRSFGIHSEHGALYEGVGIHLSWYLTGTRLTWTVGPRKYAQQGPDNLAEKLKGQGADWFPPGYELVGGKNHPALKPLLAKTVNDLETEDMLAAFTFGVWLVDGRMDDAPRFLRAAGRKELDQGARAAFGLEFNQMEERWYRWAKEMRGGGGK